MYIGTIDEMVHENAIFVLKLDRELKLYTHPVVKESLTVQEPVRRQCIVCETEYADGIPPKVKQPAQEPEELEEALKHCNGKDCECSAYDEGECACDADWTPDEVIKLRYKLNNTHPKEWQSLSGEEFVAIAKSIWGDNLGMGDGYGYTVAWASSYATIEPSSKMLLLLQAIDKALREKNLW